MKKIIQVVCGTLCAGVLLTLTLLMYIQATLPENFSVAQGERFAINSRITLTEHTEQGEAVRAQKGLLLPKVYDSAGNTYNVELHLSGSTAQAVAASGQRKLVVPGGSPFGIKMFCDGVLVVGMSDIQMGTENLNPAKDAGLRVGDILTHIDGNKVEGNNDVAQYIAMCAGDEITITVIRGGHSIDLYMTPVKSEMEQTYKAGIWVRDSSAGIGTMTYYDPELMGFAGLGHAICDVDTGEVMPLSSGEIVDVNISGVHAGQSGKPGELRGTFSGGTMGSLLRNTESGIFGLLDNPYFGMDPVPMAYKQEVRTGSATILATISGNKPQEFQIEIEKVNYSDINPTKNMVIKITDEKLLSATGGIVQGMSGSPILQDGMLVGAVTHVFVNDPARGYGIFAENMDKELANVEKYKNAA